MRSPSIEEGRRGMSKVTFRHEVISLEDSINVGTINANMIICWGRSATGPLRRSQYNLEPEAIKQIDISGEKAIDLQVVVETTIVDDSRVRSLSIITNYFVYFFGNHTSGTTILRVYCKRHMKKRQ